MINIGDLRTAIKNDLTKALKPIADKWLSSGYEWVAETKEFKEALEKLIDCLED